MDWKILARAFSMFRHIFLAPFRAILYPCGGSPRRTQGEVTRWHMFCSLQCTSGERRRSKLLTIGVRDFMLIELDAGRGGIASHHGKHNPDRAGTCRLPLSLPPGWRCARRGMVCHSQGSACSCYGWASASCSDPGAVAPVLAIGQQGA